MTTPIRSDAGLSRRTVLAGASASLLAPSVQAQAAWPSRPIKLIVPFPPGGSNDILARLIAEKMGARLGQPVVIENRGGAGGTIGTAMVAQAAPDGYTLLFASGSITTNSAAGKKLPYDLLADLQPIGQVAKGPYLVVVSNDLKVTTLRQFIERARARPKSISYGTAGMGGLNHLGTELFASAAKIEMVHVPYKGMGPAFTDLMGGTLQMALPTLTSMIPHLQGGKMRALAITSPKRSPLAPEIPTVSEAGIPGWELEVWWGLLGPAKMPAPVLKRLNDELNHVLGLTEVKALLFREGATVQPSTPEQFRGTIRAELAKWQRLIKEANITVE